MKGSPIRLLELRITLLYQGHSKDGRNVLIGAGRYTTLRARRQTWPREQPPTEPVLVVAVRGASSTILLAGLCNETANLPCRFGERALVVVRLVTCHFRDEEFKIVGHTLSRTLPGMRRRNERSS